MCDTITRNLGVVPSSDIQEWSPLDSVTNPAIPPEDPFNDLQDIPDASLTADLGFLSASNEALDKSLVFDQGSSEDDSANLFTDASFTSATILNDDFYNNLDLDLGDPSDFKEEAGIGACRDSVSSFFSPISSLKTFSITFRLFSLSLSLSLSLSFCMSLPLVSRLEKETKGGE